MVYVLSKEGTPLMPCCNAIGRLLLKQKKAKVKCKTPFTIQLNYTPETDYTQDVTLTVDTGSGVIGAAALDSNNTVLYMSQVEIRNDITEKMTRRSKYRRGRRNRNTRYRMCRFKHRANSIRTDRFSPTMRSKFDSHLKEITLICKILPVTKKILETATFDPHALKNPEVFNNPMLYQQGINFGYANTKAYVLNRDGYKCQNSKCENEQKHPKLEVHHIIYQNNNGSDDPENLVTLCSKCHYDLHHEGIDLKLKGKKKGSLSHATQMNSIRIQLLKRVPDAEETFGFITKEYRQILGLPKEHYYDAVAIASRGNKVKFKTKDIFFKKCVSDGDYQLSKGVRSEQVISTRKMHGFRKFDKVKYKGIDYFIKGKMASGYAILMDITGTKIDLLPIPKFTKMKRISARKTWIVDVQKAA